MAVSFAFRTPPGHPRGPVVMVIVLTPENTARMFTSDPYDQHGKLFFTAPDQQTILARDLDIVVAFEPDIEPILKLKREGNIGGIMKWIERGRRIEPGDGEPPVPAERQ